MRRAVTSSLPCPPSRRPTMSLLSGTGKLWAGTTIDCNFSPPCTGTSSSWLACGVADSISSERSVMNLYLIPFADNSDLIRSWSKVSHSDWLCDFGWSYNLLFSLLAALKVFALSDHTVWQTPLRFVMRLKACRNSSVVWPFVSSKWPIRDDAFVDTHTYAFVTLDSPLRIRVLQSQYQCIQIVN